MGGPGPHRVFPLSQPGPALYFHPAGVRKERAGGGRAQRVCVAAHVSGMGLGRGLYSGVISHCPDSF